MIRVTVELDKHGLGEEVKTLGVIEIGNVGSNGDGTHRYVARLIEDGKETASVGRFDHRRADGWLPLVADALARLPIPY